MPPDEASSVTAGDILPPVSASVPLRAYVALALGMPFGGYPLRSWAAVVGLAVVSQLGGVLAINYALGHLAAAVVSVSLLAQPVLAALLAILLLGEGLGPLQCLGGVLVLAGILLVHRAPKRA